MGLDKAAISENAQSLAAKGQYDKAIAEWKKLVTNTPADGNIYNTIGDLHLKRNAPADAIEAYFQAASAFKAADAAIKAAALYKKVLKLDPNRAQAYQHLGDLNAARGLVTDAVSDYLALAKLYAKTGKKQETVDTYRAVLKVDPANAEAKQRLAELAPGEPASEQAEPAAGRPESAQAGSASGGSVSSSAPKDTNDWSRQDWINEAQKQMAAGQYTEAENGLMEALSKEPGDPEVCRLLASLHLKRGELGSAKAEFRFLAEAALRALDFQLAQSMLMEYLGADADCVELRELLARGYEQSGDAASATTQYGRALEALLKNPDPEQPTLPAELYAKIVELSPASPLVGQFASAFTREPEVKILPPEPVRPAPSPEPEKARAPVEPEPVGKPAELLKMSPPAEAQKAAPPPPAPPAARPAASAFKFAAAAPDPEIVDRETERVSEEPAAVADTAEEPAVVQNAQDQPEVAPVAVASAAWEQPAEPDYGAHYELGVAYRNMGLQEEAIEEFHVATAGSDCFLDACRMLAACLTDRNMNRPAIEYLEQALGDARCKGAEADLIRYDLGVLYEAEGMEGSAVQVYSQIPSFRDVPRRLERITGSSEPVPSTVGGRAAPGESPSPERKKRKIAYL